MSCGICSAALTKQLTENENLDCARTFSFLICLWNLKNQKILIDIFNSQLVSLCHAWDEWEMLGVEAKKKSKAIWKARRTQALAKEETCFIQINSFCISNETNLDFPLDRKLEQNPTTKFLENFSNAFENVLNSISRYNSRSAQSLQATSPKSIYQAIMFPGAGNEWVCLERRATFYWSPP